MNSGRADNPDQHLLEVKNLKMHFPLGKSSLFGETKMLKAIDDVSFTLNAGETLGVVGESGCGKSTLGRAVLQLITPTAGSVVWMGNNIAGREPGDIRPLRKDMQIIFQDPLASLNPRMTIGDIIGEPLQTFHPELSRADRKLRVEEIMERVGLLRQMINRYPHEFSGGQCQRIGIARAMILQPKMIICDEPVSALDVSIQAQIINLLMDLQREFGLTLIFISHDLSVVRHISNRIMVLYLGRVIELADRDAIYQNAYHPYTQSLISAVPIPDPELEKKKQRIVLKGDLPSPLDPPSGCTFRTRCPYVQNDCSKARPVLQSVTGTHLVACTHWQEISELSNTKNH